MRTMMLAVVGMMVVGAGSARAQDATMTAMQAAQQANQDAMQATINSGMSLAAARPALPVTPRPVISKLKDGVSVTLYDPDPKAIVFYTIDGALPTVQSLRYAGPIVVSSKVRVRAMAFDVADMPSGVVSKTIRVKS